MTGPTSTSKYSQFTKLSLTKAEELASGAVFCQVLDLIYDGLLPMQKVNWTSDKSSDFLANFEVLSQSLAKFKVHREINVRRLIKPDKRDDHW